MYDHRFFGGCPRSKIAITCVWVIWPSDSKIVNFCVFEKCALDTLCGGFLPSQYSRRQRQTGDAGVAGSTEDQCRQCGVGYHYRCAEVENSKHPPVRTAPGDCSNAQDFTILKSGHMLAHTQHISILGRERQSEIMQFIHNKLRIP